MTSVLSSAEALFASGLTLHRQGRLEEAVATYQQVRALVPQHAPALHHLGIIALQAGRTTEALELISKALETAGTDPGIHASLARALTQVGRREDALTSLEHALTLDPNFVSALVDRGNVLLGLKRPADALVSFERAVQLAAHEPSVLNGIGNALLDLDRAGEALQYFSRAAGISPRTPLLFLNRALAYSRLGQPEAVLEDCRRASQLGHSTAQLHFVEGNALLDLDRASEAVEAYDRALACDPSFAKALINRGAALVALNQLDSALGSFQRGLEVMTPSQQPSPLEIEARFNLCTTLKSLGRRAESLAGFQALASLAPDRSLVPGQLLQEQLYHCEWHDYADSVASISSAIEHGKLADGPFTFLTISNSPAAQLRCARMCVAEILAPQSCPRPRTHRRGDGRLRVAYLSSDFRKHPVAQLLAGVIEAHDRSRFETYAFSTGTDDDSELRHRLKRGFEHFLDVAHRSDSQIAAQMIDLRIDILVDLNGHTAGGRLELLAQRPAPVQVSFLGYPGSLGADFVDYIIADRHVIPEADRIHYAERVIYMPDTYLPTETPPTLISIPDRLQVGLPPRGVVFCCFNAQVKLSPPMFNVWMRILNAVPDSVLWLRQEAEITRRNLEAEAVRRGIDPARLIFAPRVAEVAEHKARLALADLFLDTSPYNAHTIASEALSVGVPVITLRGNTFASRVATSLLHAAGLGHLSVGTPEAYAQLAMDLARDPHKLSDLKACLNPVRATGRLYDPVRYCRYLEAAYTEIRERHERGEQPSPLVVDSSG